MKKRNLPSIPIQHTIDIDFLNQLDERIKEFDGLVANSKGIIYRFTNLFASSLVKSKVDELKEYYNNRDYLNFTEVMKEYPLKKYYDDMGKKIDKMTGVLRETKDVIEENTQKIVVKNDFMPVNNLVYESKTPGYSFSNFTNPYRISSENIQLKPQNNPISETDKIVEPLKDGVDDLVNENKKFFKTLSDMIKGLLFKEKIKDKNDQSHLSLRERINKADDWIIEKAGNIAKPGFFNILDLPDMIGSRIMMLYASGISKIGMLVAKGLKTFGILGIASLAVSSIIKSYKDNIIEFIENSIGKNLATEKLSEAIDENYVTSALLGAGIGFKLYGPLGAIIGSVLGMMGNYAYNNWEKLIGSDIEQRLKDNKTLYDETKSKLQKVNENIDTLTKSLIEAVRNNNESEINRLNNLIMKEEKIRKGLESSLESIQSNTDIALLQEKMIKNMGIYGRMWVFMDNLLFNIPAKISLTLEETIKWVDENIIKNMTFDNLKNIISKPFISLYEGISSAITTIGNKLTSYVDSVLDFLNIDRNKDISGMSTMDGFNVPLTTPDHENNTVKDIINGKQTERKNRRLEDTQMELNLELERMKKPMNNPTILAPSNQSNVINNNSTLHLRVPTKDSGIRGMLSE